MLLLMLLLAAAAAFKRIAKDDTAKATKTSKATSSSRKERRSKKGFAFLFFSLGRERRRALRRAVAPLVSLLEQVDKGQLKVVYCTLQIVSTVSWNLNVVFPSPCSELFGLFSFFQFDWLSLDW